MHWFDMYLFIYLKSIGMTCNIPHLQETRLTNKYKVTIIENALP